ncbi:MAG: GGDEF domain-containing protein [Thiogranum sp.]|nr:GGDEF domain-containing protein [Thiogranum sp.]
MTYRKRLLLYVAMLVVLLVGMMLLSFKTARDVIMSSSEQHLYHASLRHQDRLDAERDELLHYTDIIAADEPLQHAVSALLTSGSGAETLASYYQRQFASLSVDHHAIVSRDGRVLLGSESPGLAAEVRERQRAGASGHLYYRADQGVMMVAMQPLVHDDREIATVAVARLLGEQWLARRERSSAEYLLFFGQHGRVLWSSNPQLQNLFLREDQRELHGPDHYFRLHEVRLENSGPDLPRLWFATSEARLMALLERYEVWVYLFALLGGGAVLMTGWLLLRNFSRPYEQLMSTTQQLIDGKLPVMTRSASSHEMGRLVNRFADVLDALREEQVEVRRVHRKLQETAITDSLTGLYNRRYLQEVTPGLFAQAERDQRYLTAILLDLDYFKDINDRHGHLGGDAVLVHFARLLKHNSRVNDQLFRIGGEEFLILNVTDNPEDSVQLANKLRELTDRSPANYQGVVIPNTVSAGISCCFGTTGGDTLSQLLRAADKALYEAKAGGRNQVVLHSSCRSAAASARRRRTLELVKSDAQR